MTFRKGIPTLYNGVQFRSRIEARWASFFDQLRWPWEYEPLDLAGYIPDFVLRFPPTIDSEAEATLGIGRTEPLLVEVKHELTLEVLERHTGKIESSGWTGEALIVGATPVNDTELDPDNCALGLLGTVYENKWTWTPAGFLDCRKCLHGLCSSLLSFRCRRCGDYGGGHARMHSMATALWEWRQASNRVQWRRP